ncbi:hypothetical protein APA86_25635 [Pseudomonas aeruginosa]|nr:hypothetical protein APA86_25635 [Pseudomonas aeruginosa]
MWGYEPVVASDGVSGDAVFGFLIGAAHSPPQIRDWQGKIAKLGIGIHLMISTDNIQGVGPVAAITWGALI